jgi:tRNA (mo5U34)-methyltransferase
MPEAALLIRPGSDPRVSERARSLAPWFHNLHLPDGTQTAPGHPLGDFPACKWSDLAPALPQDLSGWTALDIGCNAGFYSIQLAMRGARVTGIDREPHFLEQARWAVREFGLGDRIRLLQMQVYDLARLSETFDLVLFMGVFYHLRYAGLALDIVAEKARKLLVFQTLSMPGDEVATVEEDYPIDERDPMAAPGWPKMAFIEKRVAGDATNWWAPNHACVLALLRSTGMGRVRRIAHEMYLCEPPESGVATRRDWDIEELRAATGQ